METLPKVSNTLPVSWIEPDPFTVTSRADFEAFPRPRIRQLLMLSEPVKPEAARIWKPLPLMRQGLPAVPAYDVLCDPESTTSAERLKTGPEVAGGLSTKMVTGALVTTPPPVAVICAVMV